MLPPGAVPTRGVGTLFRTTAVPDLEMALLPRYGTRCIPPHQVGGPCPPTSERRLCCCPRASVSPLRSSPRPSARPHRGCSNRLRKTAPGTSSTPYYFIVATIATGSVAIRAVSFTARNDSLTKLAGFRSLLQAVGPYLPRGEDPGQSRFRGRCETGSLERDTWPRGDARRRWRQRCRHRCGTARSRTLKCDNPP